MKRAKRNAEKFEVFDLADAIARQEGVSMADEVGVEQIIECFTKSLRQNKDNSIMLHGRRVEAMFGYVASSLGGCTLIRREDAGELICLDAGVTPPDYRILLKSGTEFLVEVKNCHKVDPHYRLKFRKDYLNSLLAYTQAFGKPLKMAVYWSRWGRWTLFPIKILTEENGYSVSMFEAVKMGEMASLGDRMICTTPPLALRLSPSPSEPCPIGENGKVEFCVNRAELFCGGTLIDDKVERDLAWYMMLFGCWSELDKIPNVDRGRLVSIDLTVSPEVWEPSQGFASLGFLSDMIACYFRHLTAPDGKTIRRLSPNAEPGSLGIAIPDEYEGKALPLWQFEIKPNNK